jgi:hypothetical protein
VANGIFRFLGVPSVPGISGSCFSTERERLGPGDYKIWHTSRISADSLGPGWSIPASLIGPEVTAAINELASKLGYVPVTKEWGAAALAPDLRRGGTGPAAASAPPVPGSEPAWSRSWPVAQRLQAGLARIDERFTRVWEPYSAETFLVTVVPPDGDGAHSRWRVDLATRAVSDASRSADTAGASWEIIGSAEMWEQVMSGVANLSVAFRRRQLRYSDTGTSRPAVPGLRMGMIADLLGITTWHAAAAGETGDLGASPAASLAAGLGASPAASRARP